MPDLAALAASAVALLAPYLARAAEKGIEQLAESAAGTLYDRVKKKLSSPAAQEALADAAQTPTHADTQAALRVQIEKALRQDDDFARQLAALLPAAPPVQSARVSGDGNTVVQVQGAGNQVLRG